MLALVIASGFGYWSLITERQAQQFVAATATARASLNALQQALLASDTELKAYAALGQSPDQLHAQQSLADAERTVVELQILS